MHIWVPRLAISNEVVGMTAMVGMALMGQHDLAILAGVAALSRPWCPCWLHGVSVAAENRRGLEH
jgi:hypothetical protein